MGESSKKIRYSREELLSLRDLPQAQRWPEFLDRRFTLKDDKVFSAVRWLTEVAAAEDAAKASADSSPNGDRDSKADGVVLGPQRGSFNHGCGGIDGRRKGDRNVPSRLNGRKPGDGGQDHQVSGPHKAKPSHDFLPAWHQQHDDQQPQHNSRRRTQLQPHQAQQQQQRRRNPQGPPNQPPQKSLPRHQQQTQSSPAATRMSRSANGPSKHTMSDQSAQASPSIAKQDSQRKTQLQKRQEGASSGISNGTSNPVSSGGRGTASSTPAVPVKAPEVVVAGEKKTKSAEATPVSKPAQASEKPRQPEVSVTADSSVPPKLTKPDTPEMPSKAPKSPKSPKRPKSPKSPKLLASPSKEKRADPKSPKQRERLMSAGRSFDFDDFVHCMQDPGASDDKSRFQQFFTSAAPTSRAPSSPTPQIHEPIPTVSAAPPAVAKAALAATVPVTHSSGRQQGAAARTTTHINARDGDAFRVRRNGLSDVADVEAEATANAIRASTRLNGVPQPTALLPTPDEKRGVKPSTHFNLPASGFSSELNGVSASTGSVTAVQGNGAAPNGSVGQTAVPSRASSHVPARINPAFLPTSVMRKMKQVPTSTSAVTTMSMRPPQPHSSSRPTPLPQPTVASAASAHIPQLKPAQSQQAAIQQRYAQVQAQASSAKDMPPDATPAPSTTVTESLAGNGTSHAANGTSSHGMPVQPGLPSHSGAAVHATGVPTPAGSFSLDLAGLQMLNQRELQSYVSAHPLYNHISTQQMYELQRGTPQQVPPHQRQHAPHVRENEQQRRWQQQQQQQHHQQHAPPIGNLNTLPQHQQQKLHPTPPVDINNQHMLSDIERQLQNQHSSHPPGPKSRAPEHTGPGFRIKLDELFKTHSSITDHNHVAQLNGRSTHEHVSVRGPLEQPLVSRPDPVWPPPSQSVPEPSSRSSGGPQQTRVDLTTLFSSFSSAQ